MEHWGWAGTGRTGELVYAMQLLTCVKDYAGWSQPEYQARCQVPTWQGKLTTAPQAGSRQRPTPTAATQLPHAGNALTQVASLEGVHAQVGDRGVQHGCNYARPAAQCI